MNFGELIYIPARTIVWPLDEVESYDGGWFEPTKNSGYGMITSSKETFDQKVRVFLLNENREYYVRLESISIIGE